MRLTYQDCGTNIALFLEGEHDDIVEKHMSLLNHSATSSELDWINESKAKLWTTKEKLLKALVNAKLFHLLGITKTVAEYKGVKGGLLPVARELANTEFSGIDKVTGALIMGGKPRLEHVYSVTVDEHSPFEKTLKQEHGTVDV